MSESTTPMPLRKDWLLAQIDTAWVVIPQRQVRNLEVAPMLQRDAVVDPGSVLQGWIDSRGKRCPVVSLDRDLRARRESVSGRFVVVLKALHRPLGILVTSAELLDGDDYGEPAPLPPGMANAETGITHLLDIDEQRIAAVIDGLRLTSALADLAELAIDDEEETP